MTIEALKAIADALIREHVEDFEFSNIYEDDALRDLPEQQQHELLRLVRSAVVTATWKDSE